MKKNKTCLKSIKHEQWKTNKQTNKQTEPLKNLETCLIFEPWQNWTPVNESEPCKGFCMNSLEK